MELSKSISGMLFPCALVVMLGGLAAAAQAPVSNDRETVLSLAHDFLRTAYPELSGKDFTLNFSTNAPLDGSWREIYEILFKVITPPHLEVSPVTDSSGLTTVLSEEGVTSTVVQGRIRFTRSGRLVEFGAGDSEVIYSKQNADFRALVKSHPEWTPEQAAHALKDAGARFGPADKEQFIKSLQLEKFTGFMGRLTIESVEFQSPLNDPNSDWPSSKWDEEDSSQWAVKVHSHWPVGDDWTYILFFEPFNGKLIGILNGFVGGALPLKDDQ
jgi:hypothetical protein